MLWDSLPAEEFMRTVGTSYKCDAILKLTQENQCMGEPLLSPQHPLAPALRVSPCDHQPYQKSPPLWEKYVSWTCGAQAS